MSPDPRVTSYVPASIAVSKETSADPTTAPGHAAGFAAGFAAGTRAALEAAAADRKRLAAEHDRRETERDDAVRRTLSALADAATQCGNRTAPVLAEAERSLHAAAVELAEAILAHELVPGPGSARTALERARALPDELPASRIRLSPADLEHAQRILDEGSLTLPVGVTLVTDPQLRPGDALTEYEGGMLDARIASALDRARTVLLEEEK